MKHCKYYPQCKGTKFKTQGRFGGIATSTFCVSCKRVQKRFTVKQMRVFLKDANKVKH